MFIRTGCLRKRILILGTTPLAAALVELINARAARRGIVVGVVAEQRASEAAAGPLPIVGSLPDLARVIEEFQPEQIVVALAERRRNLPWCQLLDARICRGTVAEDGDALYERFTGKLPIDSLAPSDVIFSAGFRRPSAAVLGIARGIGLLAVVIGLVVLAPLFALIALAIKLDSRGPVLFVQNRIGLGGKTFRLLKFRSMHPAAEQRSEWERDNGDRITRVGCWLRKFRLDELPQFVNVLRGDMNLVGPRPHPASNFEIFALVSRNIPECGKKIPYYALRTTVRPGITGWAQVRYRYANDLDEEMEKLRYDLYYIKHLSVWLDLRILLETVKITLSRPDPVTPADHTMAVACDPPPLECAEAAPHHVKSDAAEAEEAMYPEASAHAPSGSDGPAEPRWAANAANRA